MSGCLRDTSTLHNVLSNLWVIPGKKGTAWFDSPPPHADYRFLLLRGGDLDARSPLVLFVMLNPSTADQDADDPTVAKCQKYARRFAVERGIIGGDQPQDGSSVRTAVANLYAVRGTDPKVALAHPKPVGGRCNDDVIVETAKLADLVVAAWGCNEQTRSRAGYVRSLLVGASVKLYRIGPPSKGGHPQHPLYLRGDLALEAH